MKGATKTYKDTAKFSQVSIHAPVKGVTGWGVQVPQALYSFNSRSREGSDAVACDDAVDLPEVSIHAPVQGATARPVQFAQGCEVSIHAPVKGATDGRSCCYLLSNVSIHAPVKGATSIDVYRSINHKGFNSRSREGSDPYLEAQILPLSSFNSRSREGSDIIQ